MSYRPVGLTGEQIRAARALARIDQADLARRSRLSLETIKRLERIRGPVDATTRTVSAIVGAFAEIEVYFDGCEGGGVGVCRPPQGGRPGLAARGARRRADPSPRLYRLIFHSTARLAPDPPFKAAVDAIADKAAPRNADLGLTGALFAFEGRFLQVIEGTREAVRQTFADIASDARHAAVTIIDEGPAFARLFSDWTVCCGLFESDGPSLAAALGLEDGFRPDSLTPAAALGLLAIVRDLQNVRPRRRRTSHGACPMAPECLDGVCAAGVAGPAAAG
ncbi:MAG: BLUF domain-containing protein [Pseudomonadota bacterium]